MRTAIVRHLPCWNRNTLSTQRVTWPARIASQMSIGSSVPVWRITKQMPSGTRICEIIEMYNGLFVSPVPCRPPVYARATVMNSPATLSTRSSCTPTSTTTASCIPKTASSWRGKNRKNKPTKAANQHDLQDEIQYVHRDTERHRRPRVAGRAQCAAEHEEYQNAGREAEQ